MTSKENHPLPGRLTLFKWRTISWLVTLLIQLVLALFSLIKWLFAPVALAFIIIFGIPFARFAIDIPKRPNFRRIDENDIPDSVWLELQYSKQALIKEGFIPGYYLKADDIFKNVESHILLMINRPKKMAVGVTCLTQNPGHKYENHLLSCEFTTVCPEQGVIDLTSSTEIDPFPVQNRLRLFYDTDDISLYRLFEQLVEKRHCPCPERILDRLQHTPELVVLEEFLSSFESGLEHGYAYEKEQRLRLTWKGAASSVFRTMWPTSAIYHRQNLKQTNHFFRTIGIDPNNYDQPDDYEQTHIEELKFKIKGINTAIQASKSLARQNDPAAYPVALNITNAAQNNVIESISVVYENYHQLRNGRFHYFNSFAIEHIVGENKIELMDEYDYLVPDDEWQDYDQEIKPPLPMDLSQLCSTSEASTIALAAFKDNQPDSDYKIDFFELRVMPPAVDLQLDNARQSELVWRVSGYKLNEEDEYLPKLSIINARNQQLIKVEENWED